MNVFVYVICVSIIRSPTVRIKWQIFARLQVAHPVQSLLTTFCHITLLPKVAGGLSETGPASEPHRRYGPDGKLIRSRPATRESSLSC